MLDQMLQSALQKNFGFDTFRPGQVDAMRNIMQGRDSLIVMPTGAGKSLCFQLPALLFDGTTLVISPLIALMKDQVDGLQKNGFPATYINSSLDTSEIAARLDGLRRGQWKLCYIAPERLRNQRFRNSIQQAQISLLAVDEAHCISQWGHDFRPDYRAIGGFAEQLGRPMIAALTATATPQVQDDIEQQLGLDNPYRQVTGFNRPNLRFDVRFIPGDSLKQETVKAFLDEQPPNTCGVIYVGRRRDADEIASFIRSTCHRTAVSYHGGMLAWERDQIQDQWMSGRASIVVATNAFGMGVDKPDVRFVIHYTMPGTLEGYYQEAGRAGRDGQTSHCMLLYDPNDIRLHEWFIDNSTPTLDDLRQLFVTTNRLGRRNGGQLSTTTAYLATLLNWRSDTKVRIGMRLLEQVGLLEPLGEQKGTRRWQLSEIQGRVDMDTPMREVEKQRELKRGLLQIMTDFSQTFDCRRQYLLDYFGDATPPVAEWCCDNCQRQEHKSEQRAASSPQEQAILLILDAVHHLSYGVGRTLLAKILTGSRAKGMTRYFEHPQYSALSYMKRKAVQELIDELIRKRYLQLSSGKYPTLSLTTEGQKAITQRLAILLSEQISSAGTMKRVSPKRVTDTVEETRELLEEELSAQEIADLRGLKIGTIFNHLAALIEQGKISVQQVVNAKDHALIEAAVREVGSFYLSPIKARLPEEISYGQIRCVVAAMQREGKSVNERIPTEELLFERLVEWRRKRAGSQRSYLIFSNSVLHAIAEAVPNSMAQFQAVRGVNPIKAQQYGREILAIIAEVTDKSVVKEARESYTTTESSDEQDLIAEIDSVEIENPTLSKTLDESDIQILDQLRDWRNGIAKEAGVPAYIVFNNATLDAIVLQRPSTLDELQLVPGIGKAKSERYGEAVLGIVTGIED